MQKIPRRQEQLSNGRYLVLACLGMAAIIELWAMVSYAGLIRPLFLPTPGAVADAALVLFRDLGLERDIFMSSYRVALGFLLSVAVATPLGIFLSVNKCFEAILGPTINFVRYIPSSALLPLFILWFGIGELEKVLIIFMSVTPYFAILVYDAAANTKKEYIETGYTLGAKRRDVIFRIIVPQALPGIWDAMRLIISTAWTFVILAEIVAATSGLGYLIITSSRFLQTANVIAIIIIIGLLGLLTDFLFRVTYKKFFPWAEKTTYA